MEASFAKLKTLAGEWTAKDPQSGKETLAIRYKVTAAGSATEALRLRETGTRFAAIVFARALAMSGVDARIWALNASGM